MRIVYANGGTIFETFPKHSGEQQKDVFDGLRPSVCFRPWWDMMEDNLMYFFVIMSMLGWSPSIDTAMYWPPLGMVTLPMTFLSNTPLDCTIHHSLWPNSSHDSKIPHHTRFVQSYAKKYCSETHISPFLLYLPFTLLLAPMALTACEKIFIGYQTLLLSELCSHYILI